MPTSVTTARTAIAHLRPDVLLLDLHLRDGAGLEHLKNKLALPDADALIRVATRWVNERKLVR